MLTLTACNCTAIAEPVLRYIELKTLWRQTKYLLAISVHSKSKCISKKSIFHQSICGNFKANPKCIIQKPIISLFVLFWNSRSISILRSKISDDWFGVVESAEFKFEVAENMRQEKRIFKQHAAQIYLNEQSFILAYLHLKDIFTLK